MTARVGSSPLLQVEGLTVDYGGRGAWSTVVHDLSFAIDRGEILGLAGESGCGKSTVAYALLGEPRRGSRIRKGRVLLQGTDLLSLSPAALQQLRGRRIALVPQNPTTNLTPSMQVGRQIEETIRYHDPGAGSAAARRTIGILASVGLPDPERIARRYPHQLSGGQQQRVMIALALSCGPDLIVLDEPTTGLDVTTQRLILELLARLKDETGVAMLYVSHDLATLAQICDRMAVMYAGRLVETAPVDALFARPLHPYTRGLIGSLPRLDVEPSAVQRLSGFLRRTELPPGCAFSPRCGFAEPRCREEPQDLAFAGPHHAVACRLWPRLEASAHG